MAESAKQPDTHSADQDGPLSQRFTALARDCKADHKLFNEFIAQTKTRLSQFEGYGPRLVALETENSAQHGTLQLLRQGLEACGERIVGLGAKSELFLQTVMLMEMCGTLSESGYGEICNSCRGSLRMVGWLTGRIVGCQSCTTTTTVAKAIQLTAIVSSLDTTQTVTVIEGDWCDCCCESTTLFVGWSQLVAGCTVCTTTGDDRGALLRGCIRDACDNPAIFSPQPPAGQSGGRPPRGDGSSSGSDGGLAPADGGSVAAPGSSVFGGTASAGGNGGTASAGGNGGTASAGGNDGSAAVPMVPTPLANAVVYKTIADVILGSNEIAHAPNIDYPAYIVHLSAACESFARFSRDPTMRWFTDFEIKTLTDNWGTALAALSGRGGDAVDSAARDLRVDQVIEIHDLLGCVYQFLRGGYSVRNPIPSAIQ